jgi:hypothetical protein
MVLSASTDFILTGQQVLEDALAKIGGYVNGETLSVDTLTKGRRTLNVMLKALQNRGLHTYIQKSIGITPVADQRTYTMGPSGANVTVSRPLKLIQVEIKKTSDNNRTPLIYNTYNEYNSINARFSSKGTPSTYLYEDTLTNGVLSVFPIPNAAFVASYTLEAIYRKPFDDIDSLDDNLEIPPNWYEAIIYNLAVRLAYEFPIPIPTFHILRADAREYLREAEGQQLEQSFQIEPTWD